MNKMNFEETTKYLENMVNLKLDAYVYGDWETEDNLRKQSFNLLKKMSLLRLLVIKDITNSMRVKFEIEDEIKRRVEDARKNND